MTGALIILAATVLTGIVLYIYHRISGGEDSSQVEMPAVVSDECCGQHAVCEKDTLLITDDTVVYFDDEELDRFAERSPDSYTRQEEEEIRDVMMSIAPDEIAAWARSLTLRKIQLSAALRDELLLLVSETRQQS